MIGIKTIYQVDSFTEKPFSGNPAAVMLLEQEASIEWMQNIAMEMNLSETAFLIRNENGYDIRYFTPITEINFCGHATLASAHLLYELGIVSKSKSIFFEAKIGELIIRKEDDLIVMKAPEYSLTKVNVPEKFRELIGFEPVEFYQSEQNWTIAIASSQYEIENSNPKFSELSKNSLGHLMITSESYINKVDFVVRCFVTDYGINEDPVTGSAFCALTPLWAKKTDKKEMKALQLSHRKGEVFVRMLDDGVEVCGKAVTIIKADLLV